MSRLEKLLQDRWLVLITALLVSAPLIFWNAVRYSLPIGYAGMFTLMSDQIAQNGFRLPLEVPYYGPGGVPFAYPPLGLYLFALAIKLTGATFSYLRFMPAVFSLLAFVPLYFLTNELSDSILAAAAAVLLAAAAPNLNISHIWAGGVVRSPAFGLSLFSIYFFVRAVKKFDWRDVTLAGICFGVTVLTHLTYALFAALWIAIWTFLHPHLKSWLSAVSLAVIGTLLVLPWVGVILARYGWGVFAGALDSHGNKDFVSSLTGITSVFSRVQGNLLQAFSDPLFAFLIGLGILFLFLRRKPAIIVVMFALTLLLGDAERFLVVTGCILGGIGIGGLSVYLQRLLKKLNRPSALIVTSLIVIILSAFIWQRGLDAIDHFSPRLTASTFEMTRYLEPNTPSGSSFLALVPQDEAEWLPYLMRREPVLAQWGSEWLGTYQKQTRLMLQAKECEYLQDVGCLDELIASLGRSPDYLITLKKDGHLADALSMTNEWQEVYYNDRYFVWSRISEINP